MCLTHSERIAAVDKRVRRHAPPSAVTSPGCVADDLGCPRCGYNLRTLPWSGTCPECNLSVAVAAARHGFRLADVRSLRRARYAIGVLVLSSVLAPLDLLLLTLVSLSTAVWVRDFADIERYYQVFSLAAMPLRVSGIVAPLLVAAAAWLFASAGLRLRRLHRLLAAALIAYLAVMIFDAGAAVVERLTFKPGLVTVPSPLWLWSGVSRFFLLTLVEPVPWVFLTLCIEPQQAPRLRRMIAIGGLAVSAADAALRLAGLIMVLPDQLASGGSGPFIMFPEPSRLQALYLSTLQYTAPVFHLVQLAVIWLLVRRLHAAEVTLREGAAPQPGVLLRPGG